MKLIERNSDWMYSVYQAASGVLYLEVMAGSHGLYPVRAQLDDRETELYREDAKASEGIALQILKSPDRFAGRLLSRDEWMALTGGQELP